MSSQILEPPELKVAPLGDVVDFASQEKIPEVPWLTKLNLSQPRRNVHCLGTRAIIVKRIVDLILGSAMLLLLSPLMAVVALLVKLTSRGPMIYSQTRVGLNLRSPDSDRRIFDLGPPQGEDNRRIPDSDRRLEHAYGRHFTLYKFRTMCTDAEKDGAKFAVVGDKRVTPIGRFLRKTRLDELPQLWNVLKGEMSLIGPRPERPVFMEQLSKDVPNYISRLGLKPGLTGVAQIINGYDNEPKGFRRKVAFDLLYLQNCCLWNDIKILYRTISVVLKGSGAL